MAQLVQLDLVPQDHPVDLADLFDLSHPKDLVALWGLLILVFLVVLAHHPRQ